MMDLQTTAAVALSSFPSVLGILSFRMLTLGAEIAGFAASYFSPAEHFQSESSLKYGSYNSLF